PVVRESILLLVKSPQQCDRAKYRSSSPPISAERRRTKTLGSEPLTSMTLVGSFRLCSWSSLSLSSVLVVSSSLQLSCSSHCRRHSRRNPKYSRLSHPIS